MGDHLRLASMGNRLSVYRNFAASGSTSGIRRPCNTQAVRVSRSVKREYGEGERRKLGRGRTRRLAIFRVHSVAKPQLTALLGSYSSSLNLLCPPSPSTDCPFSSGLCFHPVLLLRSPASDGDAVCFSSRPAVTCPFLLVRNLPVLLPSCSSCKITYALTLLLRLTLEFVRFLALSFLRDVRSCSFSSAFITMDDFE